jgi:hypothetical protein
MYINIPSNPGLFFTVCIFRPLAVGNDGMHTGMISKFQRMMISCPGHVLMTLTEPSVWAVQIVTSLKNGGDSDLERFRG